MSRSTRFASLLATTAVLSSSFMVGLPLASAVDTPANAAISGIPAEVTLKVHKLVGLPNNVQATGADLGQALPEGTTPGEGVTFYAYRVKAVDLTTQAGWREAAKLDLNTLFEEKLRTPGARTDAVEEQKTAVSGADGVASFDKLPVGLYLVVEEAFPKPNGQAASPAAPFLVTVPTTEPTQRHTWLDTVHVYPKNQVVPKPQKKIIDPVATDPAQAANLTGSAVGETIGFEINATAPKHPAHDPYTGFVIADLLAEELAEPTVTEVSINDAKLDSAEFDVAAYQIENRWALRISLKEEAAKKLGAADASVKATFVAKVEKLPARTLDNKAFAIPQKVEVSPENNNTWNPVVEGPKNGSESSTAKAVFGTITVTKHDEANAALADAQFQLHRCGADNKVVAGSLPIKADGKTEWTSSKEGTFTINGIHLGNIDTAATTGPADTTVAYTDLWAHQGTQFCLVEVQAPAGFALAPAPIPVPGLTANEATQEVVKVNLTALNTKANADFTLPLTGGKGLWSLLGSGVVLLLLCVALIVRSRKNF
ncbi:SpaH/EbpB family LPXTG-anchored major pilin [Corynebacterium felinum]|uniref:Fimbrial isopeptide formation D2 family protein/LPXTG-motif cell wall-anchored protein n=1 Tax=Corynebacterium felinum TaxID=131318 RepID=A0ABU2BC30_9CORY|nr:SpaH/EbpB family LPXTG-anchored major pilin [Corynebacterium felinum]MDF5819930.1 SpaH/EbpB family LPXTG-anchored major pilin [Corynebacterium felinum]MDR7355926.1 fimbrial isopeptide formation D2 family protein/LPXTG-motif cell wall-anchored protein [Corynebacterium felinum]WJY95266.1 Fimbrial subunit type 1 precursor [Corynebacterium felinum]